MSRRQSASLSRLLQKQGSSDEARRMLSEIYNWFTEGFDTADLKAAKALLDSWSQDQIAGRGRWFELRDSAEAILYWLQR